MIREGVTLARMEQTRARAGRNRRRRPAEVAPSSATLHTEPAPA